MGVGSSDQEVRDFQHLPWMGYLERRSADHGTAAGSADGSERGLPQAMNLVGKGPANRAWDQLCKWLVERAEEGGWNVPRRAHQDGQLSGANPERWPRCQLGGGPGGHQPWAW